MVSGLAIGIGCTFIGVVGGYAICWFTKSKQKEIWERRLEEDIKLLQDKDVFLEGIEHLWRERERLRKSIQKRLEEIKQSFEES